MIPTKLAGVIIIMVIDIIKNEYDDCYNNDYYRDIFYDPHDECHYVFICYGDDCYDSYQQK